MQFVNIVVHSVENMNFRVHLQHEFTQAGLDSYLEVMPLSVFTCQPISVCSCVLCSVYVSVCASLSFSVCLFSFI